MRFILVSAAALSVIGAMAFHPEPEESLIEGASGKPPVAMAIGGITDPALYPRILIKSHSGSARPVAPVEDHRTEIGERDPDQCFDCHDDDSMTMDRDGEEISLYVDPKQYGASRHAALDCVDCHKGFDPDEEPHREVIEPIDCAGCHSAASNAYARSVHSRDMDCGTCHSDVHTPLGLRAEKSVCENCHDDATANIAISAHAGNHFAPSCLDCHGPHEFEPAVSSTCLSCHGDADFVAEHVVNEDIGHVLAYERSIHGDVTECADCHAGHLVFPISDPRSVVSRQNVASTCAVCHDDVAAHYQESEHAKALATNFAQAPTCTDCHGEHDIHEISDSESQMSRSNEVQACLACHLDAPEVQERMTHSSGFVAAYEWSVHGRAAAAGNLEAAICSDCHGAHDAMKVSNPEALINKFNISETCGKCHLEEHNAFEASIHGEALAQGIGDAPTCTTCHSEHEILKTADSQSPVALINVSTQVCTPCHESFKLSGKYGFPSDRATSFSDSYHGLAGRSGSEESANCASCHGIHAIWPSADPRSRVHPSNLEATCGNCHPGANANFAEGSVHIVRTAEGDGLLYWIGTIYFLIIVVTIGGMGLHNILDWVRKTITRYRAHASPDTVRHAIARRSRLYLRMTRTERIQHILLASSFSLLAITGFMLKYPDAWWVVGMRNLIGDAFFDLRGLLHRIAAVVMVVDGLYHLYYITLTKRGRTIAKDIWLRKKDLQDFVHMLRYMVGLTKTRPRFDRFNYIEKSEYWALMWGTVIMTLTGFVLWFENHFMSEYSKLFVDVNETIHYYEAWLAFLAIVVWHFYYVIFNPDVYPMNFSWITGKMTEEEMEHEHPLELERIKLAEESRDSSSSDGLESAS